MKKIIVPFFVIVASCIGWSCSTSKILSATFEGDAVGALPAINPPEDPSGDAIEFNTGIAPRLRVQNSTISGSKALFFTHNSLTSPPPRTAEWLTFKGIETDLTQTLWYTYVGQNMGTAVSIDLTDGHANLIARMRISSNGDVGLARTIEDAAYSDVIGNVGTGTHTVVFTTTTSSLRYNVNIYKEGAPAIIAENRPMITTNPLSFNNPARPSLSFIHNGSPDGHSYVIGLVEILRNRPR
jgi:hypothetical protein